MLSPLLVIISNFVVNSWFTYHTAVRVKKILYETIIIILCVLMKLKNSMKNFATWQNKSPLDLKHALNDFSLRPEKISPNGSRTSPVSRVESFLERRTHLFEFLTVAMCLSFRYYITLLLIIIFFSTLCYNFSFSLVS